MTLQKAYFKNLETGENFRVQFNPTELNLSKSAQFAEIAIPGLDAPVQQFVRGGTETLTVELFFDTTDDGMGEMAKSVTDRTDAFYNLVKQNQNTHAPPRCLFAWGPPTFEALTEATSQLIDATNQLIDSANLNTQKLSFSNLWESWAPYWFLCIVESVERKFLLFSPEGIPLRARLTLKLREYQTIESMVGRLQSADHTKARVLKRRERLEQIAAREYENPAEWRRIAEANNIDDPRRVVPGTILQVPPIQILPLTRRSP